MQKIKTRVTSLVVGGAFVLGGLTLAGPAFANVESEAVCVPSDETTSVEETDWLLEAPEGEGWELIETRTVEDVPAEYRTEYLVGFYLQTGWLLEQPDERDWTEIENRTVIDQPFVPGEYEMSDCTAPQLTRRLS